MRAIHATASQPSHPQKAVNAPMMAVSPAFTAVIQSNSIAVLPFYRLARTASNSARSSVRRAYWRPLS